MNNPETWQQEAVREKGLCGELLYGGERICIRESGHPGGHGEAMNSPETVMKELRSLGEPGGSTQVECDLLYAAADYIDTLTTRLREVETERDTAVDMAEAIRKLLAQSTTRLREVEEAVTAYVNAEGDDAITHAFIPLLAIAARLSTERTPT